MSKTTIELHRDGPGPALDAARSGLHRALAAAGLPPYWDEWRAGDRLRPRHLKWLSGLAIVVEGRAVWSAPEPLPPPEELGQRIATAPREGFRERRREPLVRRLRFSLLPALGLVVLPKCPLCWAAYTGIVAGGGLAAWVPDPRTLAVLLAAVLLASLAAVALRARQGADPRPLLLAAAGTAAVFLGRFALDEKALTAVGFVLLAAAAGWAAMGRPARRPATTR